VSWTQAGFGLLGQRVIWIDLVGNACALATVVFAIRRTIWTWPIQLTASVLLGKALIDFWWIWMAVDVVGVPLLFSSGLVVSGLVYGVFFVLVVIGFRDRLRRYRTVEVVTA
jgi:nicotinamide riboside transporter PnuC